MDTIRAFIASRVVAILLTAFPLAAIGLAFERQDQHALDSFRTYEELRAYLASYSLGNYWACFGLVIFVGFGYVALIEGIAFVLRLAFRALRRPGDQRAA